MLQLSVPKITKKNEQAVLECLQRGSVSTYGEEVVAFETSLKGVTGYEFVCAVNSGTSALELVMSCYSNEIDVAVSDYTFIATSNAVLNTGKKVVVLGCGEDFAISPDELLKWLDSAPGDNKKNNNKVLLYTLPLGNIPVSLLEVDAICSKYDVHLIVDAAAAIAVEFDILRRLEACKAVTLSFNGNKVITSGAGGAILTDKTELHSSISRCISLFRCGQYMHSGIGQNKRMPALCASLGRSQLEELDFRVESRRKIFAFYERTINSLVGSTWQFFDNKLYLSRSFWIAAIIPKHKSNRSDFLHLIGSLNDCGINSGMFWQPISAQNEYLSVASVNLLPYQYPAHGFQLIPLPSGINGGDKKAEKSFHEGLSKYLSSAAL